MGLVRVWNVLVQRKENPATLPRRSRKNALRPPLSGLQAVNADEPNDLKTALEVVATVTGSTLSDASGLNTFSEKLKQLDREVAAVSSASSGSLGAEWNRKFLAYEGLPRIEDRNFETSMQEALQAAAYNVALYDENNFAAIGDAGGLVWLTDKKSRRCLVARGTAWLIGRPA